VGNAPVTGLQPFARWDGPYAGYWVPLPMDRLRRFWVAQAQHGRHEGGDWADVPPQWPFAEVSTAVWTLAKKHVCVLLEATCVMCYCDCAFAVVGVTGICVCIDSRFLPSVNVCDRCAPSNRSSGGGTPSRGRFKMSCKRFRCLAFCKSTACPPGYCASCVLMCLS